MNTLDLSTNESKNVGSSKKRPLSPSEWRDNKRKLQRCAGKEYISNRGKGAPVAAKQPPTNARGCQDNCKKVGCATLSIDVVHKLFKKFYELDYNGQSHFLQKFISTREPKRRRKGKAEEAPKRNSCFNFNINGKPVCAKTLVNTFCITRRRIRVLQVKIKNGSECITDGRGKHMNRPHAVNNDDVKIIKQHIESFPMTECHYSLNTSLKKCLSIDLSVRKMHRLFLEKFPDRATVSYSLYRKVFNCEYKLKFGSPRSDTCKKCNLLYSQLVLASSLDEQNKIETKSKLHHEKAESAYSQLVDDCRNTNFTTLCVDLQQALFTPMLHHLDVYYQSLYSTYNFAIHNMSYNEPNMFVWHEIIAKQGPNEIGSCILKYVASTFQVLTPYEERKLVVWSNRCVVQNNSTILTLYMYLIRAGYFSEIHQKFMTSGHSFLPFDRNFALIESQGKNNNAIVPQDWKDIICSSVSSPYAVTEMIQDHFKNFDVLTQAFMVNCSNFDITKYTWFKLSHDDPTSVYARESHSLMKPWTVFQLFKYNVPLPNLPVLYDSLLPISEEKKKDLLVMANFLVSEEHKAFYINLPSA